MRKIFGFIVGLMVLISPTFAVEAKYDAMTGYTLFYSDNEYPISSGIAKTISSPLGTLYSTGETISCPAEAKIYNGESFANCNIAVRFYNGYINLGSYQFAEQCYGTWSGALSTTCALSNGISATRWESYVLAVYSSSNFIVDGAVQDENGARLNGIKVILSYRNDDGTTAEIESTTTSTNSALQDGTFEFRVPTEHKDKDLFLWVTDINYDSSITSITTDRFQNTYTIVLKKPSSTTTTEICGNFIDDDGNGIIDEPDICEISDYNIAKILPFILIGLGGLMLIRRR